MSASSSPEALFEFTLWWPVERVPLQVEIVEPRKLTALEWALLRVMDAFRDDPPPLAEVALELGLDDPSFLRDTLREVLRLRALAPRDGQSAELSDLTFTALGERLYRKGQIEAEPSTHGVTFTIDALTDEDLPEPVGLEDFPASRFLDDQVGEPRDTLGLDRVRAAMRRFHTDVLKGDAEVRAVRGVGDGANVDDPSHAWRPVLVRVHLSPEGTLSLDPLGLTRKAKEFLASRDLDEDGVLPLHPVSEDWGETASARTTTRASFAHFRRRSVEVVPAIRVAERACRLVREARAEVVLHACWGGAEELVEELTAAARRGLRVLVVGAGQTGMFAWEEPKGFALQVQEDDSLVGALVVDGVRGLVLDDVTLTLDGGLVVVEVAATLRDAAAAEHRAELVQAALARLPVTPGQLLAATAVNLTSPGDADARCAALLGDDALRLALARLALQPTEAESAALARCAVALAPGLERLPLLLRLVTLARALAPGLAPTALEQAWSAAWEAVTVACRRPAGVHDGLFEKLARWAPPTTLAEAYVDLAVDVWVRRARELAEISRRLLAVSAAADARWRLGAARGCASWRAAREEVLQPAEWSAEALKQRAELAPRLLSAKESRAWAASCLRQIPRPVTLSGLELWRNRATPMRELAGPDFEGIVVDVLRALVDGRASDAANVRRAVGDLLPPMRLATLLLGDPPTAEALGPVWQVFGQPGAEEAWSALVERALPSWSGDFNSLEHADEVARLAALLDFPVAQKVLARWARRLADEVARPKGVEGLPWWLGELTALGPALGKELIPLALADVRPHAAAIRDARKRDLPIWAELQDAWRALAPGDSALDALAAEPVSTPHARPPDQKTKAKKGKHR